MKHEEDGFFLSEKASKARMREAENARKNRAEIVKAYSQGKVTRRELVKWGLITTWWPSGPHPRPEPLRQQRLRRRWHRQGRPRHPRR